MAPLAKTSHTEKTYGLYLPRTVGFASHLLFPFKQRSWLIYTSVLRGFTSGRHFFIEKTLFFSELRLSMVGGSGWCFNPQPGEPPELRHWRLTKWELETPVGGNGELRSWESVIEMMKCRKGTVDGSEIWRENQLGCIKFQQIIGYLPYQLVEGFFHQQDHAFWTVFMEDDLISLLSWKKTQTSPRKTATSYGFEIHHEIYDFHKQSSLTDAETPSKAGIYRNLNLYIYKYVTCMYIYIYNISPPGLLYSIPA